MKVEGALIISVLDALIVDRAPIRPKHLQALKTGGVRFEGL
jgi:hypothetical protein